MRSVLAGLICRGLFWGQVKSVAGSGRGTNGTRDCPPIVKQHRTASLVIGYSTFLFVYSTFVLFPLLLNHAQ